MQISHPILIVGQGIAGTLLSHELLQANIPFLVIDELDTSCASFVSGAALNPYSGRTIKGISRRNQLYEIAVQQYQSISTIIQTQIIKNCPLLLFDDESGNDITAIDKNISQSFLHNEHIGYYEQVSLVDNTTLLHQWRSYLLSKDLLINTYFDHQQLSIKQDEIWYKDMLYSKIIFCNGVAAMELEYFQSLRFTQNRGDILLLDIPNLSQAYIYQKDKTRLLPKGNQQFWCGSNYLWQYEDMIPNEAWKNDTLNILTDWLQIPFKLEQHICAKRPTTAGQIPFMGWHPVHKNIGICNGLGTKGFSAGPMWIADFVTQSILNNKNTIYQSVLDKWCQ